MQIKTYNSLKRQFTQDIEPYVDKQLYEHSVECMFESLRDWSIFHTLNEVKEWFEAKRRETSFVVEEIPLNTVNGWVVDRETGNIAHESNDFFLIHGVRVKSDTREVSSGWDQPIIQQIGLDGGLLGIIRQRFNGVPHYLCEAKAEPGNFGKLQISPSLQATFANIRKSHGGRAPHFSELFLDRYENKDVRVLFDAWLSEDGGRLHLKRNKGILLEVDESIKLKLPNHNFIWLSLFQIKALMSENAWINPHVRGILAHV